MEGCSTASQERPICKEVKVLRCNVEEVKKLVLELKQKLAYMSLITPEGKNDTCSPNPPMSTLEQELFGVNSILRELKEELIKMSVELR